MMRDPSHVVMVGTSLETRGGIAAVLQTYKSAGLFDRWPVDYVAAHRDGSKLLRFLKAIDGLFVFIAMLCRHPRAVLHVHSASRASFWRKSLFMLLALIARWPVIFHLHGGGFATFYDAECGPVRRAIVRFFLDRASCIVVVSNRWCAWMNRVTRNPRVVTIANPVTMPQEAGPREPATVVFTGKICEGKGVPELLQAAAALKERFPALRVEIAGDGEAQAAFAQAERLGIADRVTLHGWVGPRRRDEILARATVFVLPSHAEGLPVSMLEAMAAGCPVIATGVGGIPDVISDGFNGLLVPVRAPAALASAIERLLADPSLAFAMGRAARATIASRFTADRAVERVGRIYADLGINQLRGQTPISHPETRTNPFPGMPGRKPVESL